MIKRIVFALVVAIAGGLSLPASAQQAVSPCVRNALGGCAPVETYSGLPVVSAGVSFTNITTATDTSVKASPGVVVGLTVNTGETGATVSLYNDADGTCSSGLIGTFDASTVASWEINAYASIGICVTTATSGSPADVTVLYR